MIEYLLIFFLYGLGAYFSALEKIAAIRKRYPSASFKEIKNTYLSEEWNTIMVSAGGLMLIETFWYIIHFKNMSLPAWIHEYGGVYGMALVLGYCFQRIIYKFLGTTENAIANKIDNQNKQP